MSSNKTQTLDPTQYALWNGSNLYAIKKCEGNGYIVLAKTHGVHTYATWWASDSEDEEDKGILHCSSGHYFQDLVEAVDDFKARS